MAKLVYIVSWQGVGVVEAVVDDEEGAKRLIKNLTSKEPVFTDAPYTGGKQATITWGDGDTQVFNLYRRIYYQSHNAVKVREEEKV